MAYSKEVRLLSVKQFHFAPSMKFPTVVLCAVALALTACSSDSEKTQVNYQQVYARAIELTKNALKYPDDATFPIFDSVTIAAKSKDTVSIVFNVLAANGRGIRSKAETQLTFKIDSCAHLISGWVVDDVYLDPDPVGRPCSPAAVKAWEDRLLAEAAAEAEALRVARKAQAVEDSARFGIAPVIGQRISGSHKYGGKTKVSWTPLSGIVEDTRKDAIKKMQPEAELQARLDMQYNNLQGGHIRLDIERSTIGAANMKYFTIVVQDSTGAEILRRKLDSAIPNHSSGDWWNLSIIGVGPYLRPPFNIFIIDEFEEQPFNFLISAYHED